MIEYGERTKCFVYESLEKEMPRYVDLLQIPVIENDEQFVEIGKSEMLSAEYHVLTDMLETFPVPVVRESVAVLLQEATKNLFSAHPSYQLVVTYGFRSLEVQRAYYESMWQRYPTATVEDIHRKIAVPEVAGHPTGGAIDIFIRNIYTGESIDFGTPMYDFSTKDAYVLSPFISRVATANRMLLRDILMDKGFAPFDGEWWHFSYGDKEWAYYYGQKHAQYSQKTTQEVRTMIK